jgi:hypothetical protein
MDMAMGRTNMQGWRGITRNLVLVLAAGLALAGSAGIGAAVSGGSDGGNNGADAYASRVAGLRAIATRPLLTQPDMVFYLVSSDEGRDKLVGMYDEGAAVSEGSGPMTRVIVLVAGTLDEEAQAWRRINGAIAPSVPGGHEPLFQVVDERDAF